MSIFKHARVVSIFTGLSRLLGLLREVLMAYFFGDELAKSAFDVAFKIPNLFRRLFGEGALSAAFVPIFSEVLEQEGPEAAKRMAGKVITLLAAVLLMIAAAATLIITLIINNADLGEKTAAVLPLLRIMFPYMICICLVALCMGILNSIDRFALPAATPILLNLVWIAALFLLCPRFGTTLETRIYGVAWGILFAGALQLAIQIPALISSGMWPHFSLDWRDRRIQRILLLMGPAAIGMGIHQLNVVMDGILALWVGTWAPAALTYAERLIYLPLGLFATALSTVLLPTFSRQAARAELDGIATTMADSIRGLMVIMIPAAVGLAVLSGPLVRFIFQSGQFDDMATVRTARALMFYAPGLIVFSLYKILVPAFYALKDTRTPVRVGIMAVFINLALNILFILTWPDGYKHAGLACATVISSGLNCLILGILITRRVGSPGWVSLGLSFLKVAGASLLMAVIVVTVMHGLPTWIPIASEATKYGQLIFVGIGVSLGIISYAVAAAILCRTELRVLRQRRSSQAP
jgi:putative peptidoglycan lipid II flippase